MHWELPAVCVAFGMCGVATLYMNFVKLKNQR